MNMARRRFLSWLGAGCAAFFAACRTDDDSVVRDGETDLTPSPNPGPNPGPSDPALPVATVTLQDILTEGWSTLGSGFLGFNGPLKAELIQLNKTKQLPYIQDAHGHKFTLTPAEFAKLRRGEIVDVITTEALGHKHIVRINPARRIQGTTAITMPVEIPSGDA